jgi:hypothetical protein
MNQKNNDNIIKNQTQIMIESIVGISVIAAPTLLVIKGGKVVGECG